MSVSDVDLSQVDFSTLEQLKATPHDRTYLQKIIAALEKESFPDLLKAAINKQKDIDPKHYLLTHGSVVSVDDERRARAELNEFMSELKNKEQQLKQAHADKKQKPIRGHEVPEDANIELSKSKAAVKQILGDEVDAASLSASERQLLAQYEHDKGNECFKAKEYGDAITFYTRCQHLNSDDMSVLLNRATCWLKLKQWQNAENDIECVRRKEEANWKVYWKRALLYTGKLMHDKAIDDLNHALSLCPPPSSVVELSRLLKKAEQALLKVEPTHRHVAHLIQKQEEAKQQDNNSKSNKDASQPMKRVQIIEADDDDDDDEENADDNHNTDEKQQPVITNTTTTTTTTTSNNNGKRRMQIVEVDEGDEDDASGDSPSSSTQQVNDDVARLEAWRESGKQQYAAEQFEHAIQEFIKGYDFILSHYNITLFTPSSLPFHILPIFLSFTSNLSACYYALAKHDMVFYYVEISLKIMREFIAVLLKESNVALNNASSVESLQSSEFIPYNLVTSLLSSPHQTLLLKLYLRYAHSCEAVGRIDKCERIVNEVARWEDTDESRAEITNKLKKRMDFESFKDIQTLKTQANHNVSTHNYQAALKVYHIILDKLLVLQNISPSLFHNVSITSPYYYLNEIWLLQYQIWNNIILCNMKLNALSEVDKYCNLLLEKLEHIYDTCKTLSLTSYIHSSSLNSFTTLLSKSQYRLSHAYLAQNNFINAIKCMKRALAFDANNSDMKAEIERIEKKYEQHQAQEREKEQQRVRAAEEAAKAAAAAKLEQQRKAQQQATSFKAKSGMVIEVMDDDDEEVDNEKLQQEEEAKRKLQELQQQKLKEKASQSAADTSSASASSSSSFSVVTIEFPPLTTSNSSSSPLPQPSTLVQFTHDYSQLKHTPLKFYEYFAKYDVFILSKLMKVGSSINIELFQYLLRILITYSCAQSAKHGIELLLLFSRIDRFALNMKMCDKSIRSAIQTWIDQQLSNNDENAAQLLNVKKLYV